MFQISAYADIHANICICSGIFIRQQFEFICNAKKLRIYFIINLRHPAYFGEANELEPS